MVLFSVLMNGMNLVMGANAIGADAESATAALIVTLALTVICFAANTSIMNKREI